MRGIIQNYVQLCTISLSKFLNFDELPKLTSIFFPNLGRKINFVKTGNDTINKRDRKGSNKDGYEPYDSYDMSQVIRRWKVRGSEG